MIVEMKQPTASTKILWNTQVFAPTHYPIELVAGESFWFFDEEAEARVGFYAQAGGGWRSGAVDTVGGSPSAPTVLPMGVKLMWLSFVEARFYHVVLILPQEILQQLAAQTLATYEQVIKNQINIQFAIAPNGFVALRAGFGSHVQEVVTREAKVANASWSFFARTNHFDPSAMTMSAYISSHLEQYKVPASVLDNVKTSGMPTRWQIYSQQKFSWHIASDVSLDAYRIGYVNGEMVSRKYAQPSDQSPSVPAPAWLLLFFKRNNLRHQAMIALSEHQWGKTEQPDDDVLVFEHFVRFFADSQRPAAVVIHLSEAEPKVFLTNGQRSQTLNAKIELKALQSHEHPWFT